MPAMKRCQIFPADGGDRGNRRRPAEGVIAINRPVQGATGNRRRVVVAAADRFDFPLAQKFETSGIEPRPPQNIVKDGQPGIDILGQQGEIHGRGVGSRRHAEIDRQRLQVLLEGQRAPLAGAAILQQAGEQLAAAVLCRRVGNRAGTDHGG